MRWREVENKEKEGGMGRSREGGKEGGGEGKKKEEKEVEDRQRGCTKQWPKLGQGEKRHAVPSCLHSGVHQEPVSSVSARP